MQTSTGNLGVGADDFPIVISTMPANAGQHKIAFRGFAILVVVVAILMFANLPAARVDVFIPIIQIMMCIADLLTATFLFAQYSVQPRRALLVLASGFVFSGLFAFLQTLTFPGAYGPGVLIGDELNSAGWLFLCWHTTFPLAVIVYALLKEAGEAANPSGRSTGVTISTTIAGIVAVTAGLTWGSTAGAGYLPSLFKNATEQTPFSMVADTYLMLLRATAIVLLFIRDPRSMADRDPACVVAKHCRGELLYRLSVYPRLVHIPCLCVVRRLFVAVCAAYGDAASLHAPCEGCRAPATADRGA